MRIFDRYRPVYGTLVHVMGTAEGCSRGKVGMQCAGKVPGLC